MASYTLADARDDLRFILEGKPDGDPTKAVAFDVIFTKVTSEMTEAEFALNADLVDFVYRSLWTLRDAVFNCGYCPGDEHTATAFIHLAGSFRFYLHDCTTHGAWTADSDVDGVALWNFVEDRFRPVINAIRRTEGDCLDRTMLEKIGGL